MAKPAAEPSASAATTRVNGAEHDPILDVDEDEIQILEALKPMVLAKTWQADGTIKRAPEAKNFREWREPVHNIRSLAAILDRLHHEPRQCIVRARSFGHEAVKAVDANVTAGCVLRQKKFMADRAHHWVMMDVDTFRPSGVDPVADPAVAVAQWIAHALPPEFHGVSHYWQLSGSAGHPTKGDGILKAHVWFWLRKPQTSAQLKRWATENEIPVDESLFDPIQIHYTAHPLFEGGIVDPVPVRSGFVAGERDEVDLTGAGPAGGSTGSADATADPVAEFILNHGLNTGPEDSEGRIPVNCPRAVEHTTESGPSSTVWLRAGTGGYATGHFSCMHTSCGKPTTREYVEWLNSAHEAGLDPVSGAAIRLEDFYALPSHEYIYVPTRQCWNAATVNSRLKHAVPDGVSVCVWLDTRRPVECCTWHPDHPEIIDNKLVLEGGFVERPGVRTFNFYRPAPALIRLTGSDPGRWREHLRAIYPAECQHIEHWLAQRVQSPGVKVNHALVFGGRQGIGKDSLLEPVKRGMGSWNWKEISPQMMLGRFNGWIKAVVVRVSELRDLGDVNRYAFYDHSKQYLAAPPDTLTCDEKHIREHHVFNVAGFVLTTNHKTGGLFLPPDDRRHYVAWSEAHREDFDEEYWRGYWNWLDDGGTEAVMEYLDGMDLSGFDPKAPPERTDAWWAIVNANEDPDTTDLRGVLSKLARPAAVTLQQLIWNSPSDLAVVLSERKNRRRIPHLMDSVGYAPIRNPSAKEGRWMVGGRDQVVYARADLDETKRIEAARGLVAAPPVPPEV